MTDRLPASAWLLCPAAKATAHPATDPAPDGMPPCC